MGMNASHFQPCHYSSVILWVLGGADLEAGIQVQVVCVGDKFMKHWEGSEEVSKDRETVRALTTAGVSESQCRGQPQQCWPVSWGLRDEDFMHQHLQGLLRAPRWGPRGTCMVLLPVRAVLQGQQRVFAARGSLARVPVTALRATWSAPSGKPSPPMVVAGTENE